MERYSASLQKLWYKCYSTISDVNYKSAAYVARYVLKKVNGDAAEKHYERFDSDSGELIQLPAEYATQSRRPGIGRIFVERFLDEIYPDDFVVVNGQKLRPPKYYDGLYELENPDDYIILKNKRKALAKKAFDKLASECDYHPIGIQKRYDDMNAVLNGRLNLLPRNVE